MPRKLLVHCAGECETNYAFTCLMRLRHGLYPIPGFNDPNRFRVRDGRAPPAQGALQAQLALPAPPGGDIAPLLAIEDRA